jgi:S1-C subfamily serine protease
MPLCRASPGGRLRSWLADVAACALAIGAPLMVSVAFAAEAPANAAPDAERLFDAIVKVETRAVPGARSIASLGQEREGTGIVIADDGLILTIGYLLVEADDVKVIDHAGRSLPARVAGYDHATGFGLVRTIVPLAIRPVPFGDPGKTTLHEPIMIVNHEGAGAATLAYIVSRRPFTANWEYMLDYALFTAPPALNWSGAALIDKEGRLLGIGSLIVRDAMGGDGTLPGNMFVPIDALKPILADLARTGRRAGPARPWLGVAADEVQGRLVVTRVSPNGPADRAGLGTGDIILGVGGDGVRTQAEFYQRVWGRGAAGTEIPLRVLQGIDVNELKVRSIDRVEYFRPATTY